MQEEIELLHIAHLCDLCAVLRLDVQRIVRKLCVIIREDVTIIACPPELRTRKVRRKSPRIVAKVDDILVGCACQYARITADHIARDRAARDGDTVVRHTARRRACTAAADNGILHRAALDPDMIVRRICGMRDISAIDCAKCTVLDRDGIVLRLCRCLLRGSGPTDNVGDCPRARLLDRHTVPCGIAPCTCRLTTVSRGQIPLHARHR